MNSKGIKSTSSKSMLSNEMKQNDNVISKLRRLKIEENILLQSLKKHDQKRIYEGSELDANNDVEYKNTMKTLENSFINVKNLFNDIKVMTCSQEILAEVEIDDIKKKVLELETTMRSFKLYLDNELNVLKCSEQELNKELEEINYKDSIIKKKPKISTANFKQAVPSPVRLLMTSPLKCTEVQEFQDFMKNSPNRYGGWNEYHHNIFVKIWQKYFGNISNLEYNDDLFSDNSTLQKLAEESLSKLQGIDKKNLMSHVDWYKKYLFFKSKQQTAINKWKSSKISSIKVSDDDGQVQRLQNQIENNYGQPKRVRIKKVQDLTISDRKIGNKDIERIMAPTKQWLNRCEYEAKMEQIPSVENLEKLRIPNWRKYL